MICNGWSVYRVNINADYGNKLIRTGLLEEVICGHGDDMHCMAGRGVGKSGAVTDREGFGSRVDHLCVWKVTG